jgi:hypothetical protein
VTWPQCLRNSRKAMRLYQGSGMPTESSIAYAINLAAMSKKLKEGNETIPVPGCLQRVPLPMTQRKKEARESTGKGGCRVQSRVGSRRDCAGRDLEVKIKKMNCKILQ